MSSTKMIYLRGWCERYSLQRGLVPKAAYVLGRSVAVLEKYLQRRASIKDLDNEKVSLWVQWMESQDELGPRTRAGYRGNVISLWRFIAQEDGIDWPGRIRRAPKPEPQPVAWTIEELKKLREAATRAGGKLHNTGVSRSLYLTTLLDAAYESGLRRGDLWKLEQGHFMPNGVIVLRQNKTKWPHEPLLRLDTLERVRQLPGKYPLKWNGTEKGFYECWRIWMLKPSGVRPGVLQQLRRTGATQLESIRPQDTQRYLGHKTESMKRHYVDRSQAYGPAPQPPRFWGDPDPPPDAKAK